MAEQLYTIPVNDAFSEDSECPLCLIAKQLEQDAIEFTMGPSYMEDDNREQTDELGFCPRHIAMMYQDKNKLGVALMLNTHMNKTIRDIEKLAEKDKPESRGLLSRKKEKSPVVRYINKLEETCFVCQRINPVYDRYVHTIFHMWAKDPEFKDKVKNCKGFCTYHFGQLYDRGADQLKQDNYTDFVQTITEVYVKGIKRVNDDVSWFIDKRDYRNKEADWKNSKDAVQRGITKACHTIVE